MTTAHTARDWRHRAACRGWPEPLWDDRLPGEPDTERDARHADAIYFCRECPVTTECDASRDERDPGVWAGKVYHGPGVPVDMRVARPSSSPRPGLPATVAPIAGLDVRACAGDCGALIVSRNTWRKHEHLRRHRIHMARGLCGPCYSRWRREKIKGAG